MLSPTWDSHPLFPLVMDSTMLLSHSGLDNQTTHPLISTETCQRQGLINSSPDTYDEFLIKYIEVEQIHKMELDRIFRSCDEYCNRYAAMLATTSVDQFLFETGIGNEHSSKDAYGFSSLAMSAIRPLALSNTPPAQTVNPRATNSVAGETDDVAGDETTEKRDNNGNTNSLSPEKLRNKLDRKSKKDKKNNKRRGTLPKHSVDKLKSWLKAHLNHPYPSEQEKNELVFSTGLTMNQVVNWFINARRRIVPPLIEAQQRKSQSKDRGNPEE